MKQMPCRSKKWNHQQSNQEDSNEYAQELDRESY